MYNLFPLEKFYLIFFILMAVHIQSPYVHKVLWSFEDNIIV